jgi:hypothetical protein
MTFKKTNSNKKNLNIGQIWAVWIGDDILGRGMSKVRAGVIPIYSFVKMYG